MMMIGEVRFWWVSLVDWDYDGVWVRRLDKCFVFYILSEINFEIEMMNIINFLNIGVFLLGIFLKIEKG